ncbi:hypothetical protein L7F22_048511 [Adiantum nelumboides]|nr:hypothetical protein [Adiantum nelumboides]
MASFMVSTKRFSNVEKEMKEWKKEMEEWRKEKTAFLQTQEKEDGQQQAEKENLNRRNVYGKLNDNGNSKIFHCLKFLQISDWMLRKGEGKTLRTYEAFLKALDMNQRVDQAEAVWKNEILKSSWSIPTRLVTYVLAMFERHQKPLEVIKGKPMTRCEPW